MYISVDTIIEISKVIGALGAISGFLILIYKFVKSPKDNASKIDELEEQHNADIADIKNELCVMNYALLATLDGLKQLHCNGNVTEAYNMLEKHLNKQAHSQN